MAICSRNYSLCCTVLSGWGIIQLIIMGFLFYYQAVAFAEDLDIEIKDSEQKLEEFWEAAAEKYETTVSFAQTFSFILREVYHRCDSLAIEPFLQTLCLPNVFLS